MTPGEASPLRGALLYSQRWNLRWRKVLAAGDENARIRNGGRAGYPSASVDPGTRQAGRPVWRQVPDHRLRSIQPGELGDLFHLRAGAVSIAVADRTSEGRMAVRRDAAGAFHYPGACADADGRELVSGHRRRDLPEPEPVGGQQARYRGGIQRRPYLSDGRAADAGFPSRAQGRGYRRRAAGGCRSERPV